jgi:glycosyltransferase involved in cell wall biosynthesis
MSSRTHPRVMLVGPMPPTKGGMTTFMLNLMASNLNKEFEFVPYSVSRPPKKNVIVNYGYAAIFRGGWLRVLQGILITVWRLFRFPIVLMLRQIDLVQIQASDHHIFWESVLYAIISRLLGRPVLFRIGGSFDVFHGESPPVLKRLIETSLRIPEIVIVQSLFSRDYVRRAGRTAEIVILPNWSRDPVISSDRSLRVNPICMFIAGTEARRKGVDEVIEAVRQLDTTRCAAHFHFVAMVPQLVGRLKEMHVSNIAKVDGHLDHAEVLQLMRQCDIFLLPSHAEGFPNSLIEAMAAGMASIVTPVAAVPEIVADGGALVVPVGDATALAGAIQTVATNSHLRQELGKQAQETVRQKYTPQKALPALGEAYRRLLANAGTFYSRA